MQEQMVLSQRLVERFDPLPHVCKMLACFWLREVRLKSINLALQCGIVRFKFRLRHWDARANRFQDLPSKQPSAATLRPPR